MKENQNIVLTWRGHSCFKISCGDFSVVVDPYSDDTVPGFTQVRETANQVICSHTHADHNSRESVTLVDEEKESPFIVTKVACPHDDDCGRKRGMNLIHVFDNGTLRIAHFGDIGCPLGKEQLEAIGQLDAALVPVGGYFTMEPDGIAALMRQMQPRVVVPMHYRSETFGYPVIGTLEDYLKLVEGNIVRYEGNSLTITPDTPAQTAVLTYLG